MRWLGFPVCDVHSKASRVSRWPPSDTTPPSPSSSMEKSTRWATARWSSPPSPAAPTPATRLSCLEQVATLVIMESNALLSVYMIDSVINWTLNSFFLGLLAKKAIEMGLSVNPYIKTSLSPGSGVVTYYLKESGVMDYLSQMGWVAQVIVFHWMCVEIPRSLHKNQEVLSLLDLMLLATVAWRVSETADRSQSRWWRP